MQGRLIGPSPTVVFLLSLPWLHAWAPGPHPNTWPMLIGWGSALVLYLLRPTPPQARELAMAWALSAALGAVIGLIQYFGLAGHAHGWLYHPPDLGNAAGQLRQRNQLASHLLLGAVSVLWWQAQGLPQRRAWALLALLATGLAATSSRTGLLSLVLLPLLAWVWRGRPEHALPWSTASLGVLLGSYALASLLLPGALAAATGVSIENALMRLADTSGAGRTRLWANVLELIAQRPWTGWGWGELKFAQYSQDFSSPRFIELMGHAHNLPLHLAVTLGVPLAGLLCALLLWALWRARPGYLQGPADDLAWGVLTVIGVHSLLEYPLWYSPFQLALLWALGLLRPQVQARVWAARRWGMPTAMLAVGLGLWVAMDHTRMRQVYLPAPQRLAIWREAPWEAARQSVLFADAVDFAWLVYTPVTPQNAPEMLALGLRLLHYSPEPRVIRQVIASARLLGQHALADWHQQRLEIVWPQAPR